MPKMWKGPCAELKADYDDLLARRLHRRASRLLIAYYASHDGRSAEVHRIEKRAGEWYMVPLGTAYGDDVPNLWLNIHLQYTPFDAELFEIGSAMILRRSEDIVLDCRHLTAKLEAVAEVFLP